MSYYSDITVINNGVVIRVPVTNEWVLANKENTFELSLDKSQIIGNGVDSAILTVQLKTPYLVDGTRDNKSSIQTFKLIVSNNEESVEDIVSTNENGVYTTNIVSYMPNSTYNIRIDEYGHNALTLEVLP